MSTIAVLGAGIGGVAQAFELRPKLGLDEIAGLGPNDHTNSISKTRHALEPRRDFDALIKEPGSVIVGANLFQSAFTGFCPIGTLMHKLGIKTEREQVLSLNN